MLREASKFQSDESGAISAIYALALFGLIAMAGVGWDYGRLMTMDSELQNAADQAALAAATQLDGRSGAIARAQDAANSYLANASSAFVNVTRAANDGDGRAITQLTFVFYESYDSATDTFGTVTTDDDDAAVVQVIVNGREAFYALTPVVGLISSGSIAADAVAGIESATCNVPPLMFCAPSGRNDFPTNAEIGIALDLRERANNSDDFSPGNFDLLDIAYTNVSNSQQNRTLGLNSDLLGCTGGEIVTNPGFRTPQTTAFNTRFDVYPNGNGANYRCNGSGDFCPGDLLRNNVVRVVQVNQNSSNNTCSTATGGSVVEISSLSDTVRQNIPLQEMPLDSCLISGSCGQSFGDGAWSASSYMSNVHGITTNPSLISGLDGNGDGRITRYEVYQWERADSSRRQSRELYHTDGPGNNRTLYCTQSAPVNGTPVVPSSTQKDRRIVTVASVDCANLGGRSAINTIKFVDLFMLGPAIGSGSGAQIHAEIVGPATRAGGGTGFQYFGRNKPVLLR